MEKALTASKTASNDSGATAHMIKDVSVITGKAIKSATTIEIVGNDTIEAMNQGESMIKMTGGEVPVTLNRALHISKMGYSLVSVSSLCDDDQTMKFTNEKRVVKIDNRVVDIGECAIGMYSLNIDRASDKALADHDVIWDMLSVWHLRFAHADQNAITKMSKSGAACRLIRTSLRSINSCSPRVERAMTKTPVQPRTNREKPYGAVLYTDGEEMNISSVRGARYLITFVDEAFWHVRACHMNENGEAAGLLRRRVCWLEQETDCRVEKILLDGDEQYAKGTKEPEANRVKLSVTASCTSREMDEMSE